jgi:hypothetical protein
VNARRKAVAPHSWDGLFERLDAACLDVLVDVTVSQDK